MLALAMSAGTPDAMAAACPTPALPLPAPALWNSYSRMSVSHVAALLVVGVECHFCAKAGPFFAKDLLPCLMVPGRTAVTSASRVLHPAGQDADASGPYLVGGVRVSRWSTDPELEADISLDRACFPIGVFLDWPP